MLQNLWHELGHYRVIQKKCLEDVAILKNFIEKDRVYDFLVGLNAEFDQVRIQILGKEDVVDRIRVCTQVHNTITKRLLSNPRQTAP